jgi:hypothetical protein
MIQLNLDNVETALLISLIVENSRNSASDDNDIFGNQSMTLFHEVMRAVRSSKAGE